MKPIRIGIVGAGRILPAHLRGYQRLREVGIDNFRITALTSRTRSYAESYVARGSGPAPRAPVSHEPNDPLSVSDVFVSDFQSDLEPRVFDSLEDVLAADEVDALDITASLGVHHTAALQGLQAGKHCLVQKPLAITVAAGRRMVEEAHRRNLSLGVTENVRYAPSTRRARWVIDEGYLGDIQMIAMWAIGTPEWSPDKVVAQTPWRHKKLEAGGGASLDIGVHLLHEFRYLAGELESMFGMMRVFEPIRRLNGGADTVVCDADDAFFATMSFANGAVGQLTFTWAGHGAPTRVPEGRVIYGTRGCLKGDVLVLDDGSIQSASYLFESKAPASTREQYFPRGLSDTFAIGALDFLRAIERGGDPEASGYQGLLDLASAFAICESATLEKPVSVTDVLEGRVAEYQREINEYYGL